MKICIEKYVFLEAYNEKRRRKKKIANTAERELRTPANVVVQQQQQQQYKRTRARTYIIIIILACAYKYIYIITSDGRISYIIYIYIYKYDIIPPNDFRACRAEAGRQK